MAANLRRLRLALANQYENNLIMMALTKQIRTSNFLKQCDYFSLISTRFPRQTLLQQSLYFRRQQPSNSIHDESLCSNQMYRPIQWRKHLSIAIQNISLLTRPSLNQTISEHKIEINNQYSDTIKSNKIHGRIQSASNSVTTEW